MGVFPFVTSAIAAPAPLPGSVAESVRVRSIPHRAPRPKDLRPQGSDPRAVSTDIGHIEHGLEAGCLPRTVLFGMPGDR
jgi:hypothetical protein